MTTNHPASLFGLERRFQGCSEASASTARSRDWVLDRLARTWDAHGGDDERYVAALKEL